MFKSIKFFRPLIEMGMTDKLDISRYEKVTNADKTTHSELKTIPEFTGMKCRISFSQSDSPISGDEAMLALYRLIKVFAPIGLNLLKGDTLTVYKMDGDSNVLATYSGIINKPMIYETHQEIMFLEVGMA